jgi:segregation and condensation protein A
MEEAYKIKLPLFEGPLDLLIHLIKEQKIDIYDIPISLITRQYLEYIKMMKELNLEIAGDFLVMAATLIHIKSRMLLPVEEVAGTEEPEDPRLELVMRLLEYQAFKDAALGLKEKEAVWADVFYRIPVEEEPDPGDEAEPALFDLNLFDLLGAFRKILERAPAEVMALTRETLTLKEKMSYIIEVLQYNEAVRFEDLFRDDMIKSHFLVTFTALLELMRLGLAKAYQEGDFGVIWIIRPEEGHAPREGEEQAPEAGSPVEEPARQ